jgi:hypothetical protein
MSTILPSLLALTTLGHFTKIDPTCTALTKVAKASNEWEGDIAGIIVGVFVLNFANGNIALIFSLGFPL